MDCLLLFPEPFPDESLYSLAVRYHQLVANHSYRRTSQELFGTYSRTCGSVLPCCLGPLSQRLEGQYSVAELVETRTLLPLYKPFLSDGVYESAVQCMQSTQGTGLKMSLGMTASGLLKHASFRYCEACMQQDADNYGVSYWHRIHAAAGVCTCPHHGNVLLRATFSEGADWRCMMLPAELPGTPVLSDCTIDPANAVATMLFWGLEHPHRVSELLRDHFLRYRLLEMGLLQRGRLKEQAIHKHVTHVLRQCPQESEFKAVTSNSDWVLCLLRRRGRIIQPFRFYLLCWVLGSTLEELCDFDSGLRSQEEWLERISFSNSVSASEENIAKHRLEFLSDCNSKCHNKAGYHWLFTHDYTWLQAYTSANRVVSVRKARVDWDARDTQLSLDLIAARNLILAERGKPIKVTKASLLRNVSACHGFPKNSFKFPKSERLIATLVETEHDYQIRKIIWALNVFHLSESLCVSAILRTAGIRVSRIDKGEMNQIIIERRLDLLEAV